MCGPFRFRFFALSRVPLLFDELSALLAVERREALLRHEQREDEEQRADCGEDVVRVSAHERRLDFYHDSRHAGDEHEPERDESPVPEIPVLPPHSIGYTVHKPHPHCNAQGSAYDPGMPDGSPLLSPHH